MIRRDRRTQEQIDHLARSLALYYTGDDPGCTASAVAEWPEPAKLALERLYDDAVAADAVLAIEEESS